MDKAGASYSVKSAGNWGAPSAAMLLWELSNDRPIIAGYRTGGFKDHAVVITGAWYEQSARGPIVQYLVVRDPNIPKTLVETPDSPGSLGRVTYIASRFIRAMKAHWYIKTI